MILIEEFSKSECGICKKEYHVTKLFYAIEKDYQGVYYCKDCLPKNFKCIPLTKTKWYSNYYYHDRM